MGARKFDLTDPDGGSTPDPVPVPTGTATGDLLLAQAVTQGLGADNPTPSGWSVVVSSDTGGSKVFARVAGATEGSHPFFGTAAGAKGIIITAWRRVDTAAGDKGIAYASELNGSQAPSFTWTSLASPALVVGWRVNPVQNISQPSGLTTPANGHLTTADGTYELIFGYKQEPNGPNSTYPWRLTAGGATSIRTFALALRHAPQTPYAPTNLTLGGAAHNQAADLSGTSGASWTFSSPEDGQTQSAFALRRKSGTGSYQYWRQDNNTWQSSEFKNLATATGAIFPSGSWVNGTTYQWSVRTWDAADRVGGYAFDQAVTASTPPSVTITAPANGSQIDQPKPVFSWSYSDPEGDPQSAVEIKVFRQTDIDNLGGSSAPSTPPTSITPVFATLLGGTLSTTTSTEEFANRVSYRAYLRVAQEGSLFSPWANVSFSEFMQGPQTPQITGFYQPEVGRSVISAGSQDNLHSAAAADFEGSLGGVTSISGGTVVISTSASNTGTRSVRLTHSGTSDGLKWPQVDVDGNKVYTALVSVRQVSGTPRSFHQEIIQRDDSGSVINTLTSPSFTEVAGDDPAPSSNPAPTARITVSPSVVYTNDTVTLSGLTSTSSPSNIGIPGTGYLWTQEGGEPRNIEYPGGPSDHSRIRFTAPGSPGGLAFGLTVVDNNGTVSNPGPDNGPSAAVLLGVNSRSTGGGVVPTGKTRLKLARGWGTSGINADAAGGASYNGERNRRFGGKPFFMGKFIGDKQFRTFEDLLSGVDVNGFPLDMNNLLGNATDDAITHLVGVPLCFSNETRRLAEGAAGEMDAQWYRFGQQLATFPAERINGTILRMGWEFLGNWYFWGIDRAENHPVGETDRYAQLTYAGTNYAQYYARAVGQIFQACDDAGKPRPRTTWNMTSNIYQRQTADNTWYLVGAGAAYPGDEYVDIVSMDLYGWFQGANQANVDAMLTNLTAFALGTDGGLREGSPKLVGIDECSNRWVYGREDVCGGDQAWFADKIAAFGNKHIDGARLGTLPGLNHIILWEANSNGFHSALYPALGNYNVSSNQSGPWINYNGTRVADNGGGYVTSGQFTSAKTYKGYNAEGGTKTVNYESNFPVYAQKLVDLFGGPA